MQFTIIDLPIKRELRTIDLHSVYDHHLLILRGKYLYNVVRVDRLTTK